MLYYYAVNYSHGKTADRFPCILKEAGGLHG